MNTRFLYEMVSLLYPDSGGLFSDGMPSLYPDSGVWFSDGYAIFALVQERDSWTLNGMVYL